ncbi:cupin domain-containing protein [Paractinoplanes durhamensis]|uniref:Cupin n=1 Tax=Paractinoplanes durhamensis TaxID=113563 RepID=A0ABQ3Z815_9ACTN|nr:cupin domain-containing protein [Actinoplanes durhamensis]GIE05977.1 cupin [Actinoplanes durhamensis]
MEIFRLADIAVDHSPAGDDEVVAGAPTLGATPITRLGGTEVEVGVWEMSVGAVRDVEVDEVFLLLAGAATITVDGAAPVAISAGDLVRLTAGTKTVWEVSAPLRKLYVA